jgi:hypothetical protein
MATSTLPFDALELVSCTRVVPENGSPSSQDYNDTQSENLIDHAALTDTINTIIRPLLMALTADAATRGLIGDTLYTDSVDSTALCFNALTNQPLTVKQSLQYLQAIVTALQTQVTNTSTQIGVITSQLSSTNQNSIALSLQNFQSSLNQQANALTALQNLVTAQSAVSTQTNQIVTPTVQPNGQESVACNWPLTIGSDTYTVSCSVEDPSGYLSVDSWSYITGGVGVSVVVSNSDPNNVHTGTVHVCAFVKS